MNSVKPKSTSRTCRNPSNILTVQHKTACINHIWGFLIHIKQNEQETFRKTISNIHMIIAILSKKTQQNGKGFLALPKHNGGFIQYQK